MTVPQWYWAVSILSRIECSLLMKQRRQSEQIRRLACGDNSGPSLRVFENFNRYLCEFLSGRQKFVPDIKIECADGWEKPDGPVIVLTGHLGNWELGAAAVAEFLKQPMAVVALDHSDKRLNERFNRIRRDSGLSVLALNRFAAKESLRALHSGLSLGVLADRTYANVQSIEVTWGALKRSVPLGPAVLSVRTKTPVVPAFMIRKGQAAFRLFIERPLWPQAYPGKRDEAARLLAQAYADVIHRYICRFPEQWIMFE